MSSLSVVVFVLMGNRTVWGPFLGIVAQALWIYYSVSIDQMGLIPGTAIVMVVQARNFVLWRRERAAAANPGAAGISRRANAAQKRLALLYLLLVARACSATRRISSRRRTTL